MRFVRLTTVTSTNDAARQWIAQHQPTAPVCILADEQTAGRGTHSRRWVSPPGAGIYMSVIDGRCTKMSIDGGKHAWPPVAEYTLAAGVACVQALRKVTGAAVGLKPINDLVAQGCKLGGILTEAVVEGGELTALVTGVGINVIEVPLDLPRNSIPPISLQRLMPADQLDGMNVRALAEAIAGEIAAWNAVLASDGIDIIRQAWERHRCRVAPSDQSRARKEAVACDDLPARCNRSPRRFTRTPGGRIPPTPR